MTLSIGMFATLSSIYYACGNGRATFSTSIEGEGMRHIIGCSVTAMMLALAGCGSQSQGDAPAPKATLVSEQSTDGAPASSPAPAAGNSDKPAGDAPAPAANDAAPQGKPTGDATANSGKCSDSNDRNVVVRNDSSNTVRELYGSNVNRTTWEEDVLGSNVLPAGRRITVNWDDGSCECNFDFRAVFMDGTERVQRGFNVCREAQWRIGG